jgi:hypothetical protein
VRPASRRAARRGSGGQRAYSLATQEETIAEEREQIQTPKAK